TRAAAELITLTDELIALGHPIMEVSVGGGWAVPYRLDDPALAPEEVARAIAQPFADKSSLRPAIEPGRALVARAAVALYRVGSVKQTGDTRFVAVDGGMGDNPRPALY